MDVNYTYCCDHFAIYINIKSFCCISKANLMLYVNFISVKKKQYCISAVLSTSKFNDLPFRVLRP